MLVNSKTGQWKNPKLSVAQEISTPGKFILDTVSLKNNNGTFWVNVAGQAFSVAGQVLESSPHPWIRIHVQQVHHPQSALAHKCLVVTLFIQ